MMESEREQDKRVANARGRLSLSAVLAVGLAGVWLLGGIVTGAGLVPGRLQGVLGLRSQNVQGRQERLLSTFTPLADDFQRLADTLPADAKVFMMNATVEEYYLANYLLYPRRVLVDEPGVRIDGVRGQKVGRQLSLGELKVLGVTHVLRGDGRDGSLYLLSLGGRDD